MKRHLSVFYLMVRSTFGGVMLLLAAMTALECAIFTALTLHGPKEGAFAPELILKKSGAVWIFAAAALLLTLLLCRTGAERKTKTGCFLRRLRVSEQWVFFWQSVYNTLCYLLLWAWQSLTALLLCRIYLRLASADYITGQTVFLAWYRSDFLHALLPMEEGVLWAKNALLALALGIAAARYPMGQRRGSRLQEIGGALCAAIAFFVDDIGSITGVIAILVSVITIGVSVYRALDREGYDETEKT